MPMYLTPPKTLFSETGNLRQVGFELEFSALLVPEVSDILANAVGGYSRRATDAEYFTRVENIGEFKIELDWEFGKQLAAHEFEGDKEIVTIAEDVITWITETASQIVPVEVVCPPIPIDQLALLDPMVKKLRAAGAEGTNVSPVYAFGVHLNPEPPDLSARTISNYLKAFVLMQEWLVTAHQVDLTRRITPYIDLYPKDYCKVVLNYGNQIDQTQLLDDYLTFNPTRNRALDLTPMIKHLDADLLDKRLKDSRINARPTFHYRLPNCNIEQPDWHLSTPWNIWCVLETIAGDPDILASLTHDYLEHHDTLIQIESPPWHSKLDSIAERLLSA